MQSRATNSKASLDTVMHYLPPLAFLLSLLFCIVSFLKGWNGTLCEFHGFRQTQTAITVSYLLKGGPWLAYQTPVFGPPWSIPMEFPLYQWIVAIIAKAGMFPVDQAGRFVSASFFLASLYPASKILEALKLSRNQIFLILAIYCHSPLYLYWSRTFMIESTVLALSTCYLWLVFLYFDDAQDRPPRNILLLLGIGIIGSLAAAVKITTFFAFAAGAFILSLQFIVKAKKEQILRRALLLRGALFGLFAFILPLLAVLLWTSYSDSLKDLNPLGQRITSSALTAWNFGTLSQKLSPDTWRMFYVRMIKDLIGSSWLLPLSLSAGFLCRPDRRKIVFASLFLFVLSLATFTNLYYIHNYYAYANGVFFLVAIGVIIADLWEASHVFKRTASVILLGFILSYSSLTYAKEYWPKQGKGDTLSAITQDFKDFTREDEVVVIFGEDWNSEIPYYIGRRAVMIPNWMPLDFSRPSFQKIKHNLDGYGVGAVIFGSLGKDMNPTFIRAALSEFGLRNDAIAKKYIIKEFDGSDNHLVVFYQNRTFTPGRPAAE